MKKLGLQMTSGMPVAKMKTQMPARHRLPSRVKLGRRGEDYQAAWQFCRFNSAGAEHTKSQGNMNAL